MDLTLRRVLTAARYRIQSGSRYLWNSFGPNARYLDLGNFEYSGHPYWTASVIYDTKTLVIYEVVVYDGYKDPNYYLRWVNPKSVRKYKAEHKRRGFDYIYGTQADRPMKDVKPDTILQKIRALQKYPDFPELNS